MEYPRAKFHEVNNALWSMHLRGKKKKKRKTQQKLVISV